MENSINKWNAYIGIAVEDKVYDTRLLKVYVTELAPYISGEIKDLTGKEKVSLFNNDKKESEDIEINSTNIVTAEYFGLATNRVFPPDIRKGEQVLIIQYRDIDKFFWISLGRDDKLRRKEVFRLAVSNDDAIDKDIDEENTYFVEMDTLFNKRIRLITSKSDGEKYKYSVVIDAKNHYVAVYDDDDNEFILESDIPRLKMKNKSKSLIDINDECIFLACKKDISVTAGRQFVLKTPTETRIVDKVSLLKTHKQTIEANSIFMDCPAVEVNGVLKVHDMIFTPLTVSTVYNTGPLGADYEKGETNVKTGSSVSNDAVPPAANPGTGQRHCVAWEQNDPNMTTISACFAAIQAIHSSGPHSTVIPFQSIIPTSAISIMPMNKGE